MIGAAPNKGGIMASEIVREDRETVAIIMSGSGSIGITTKLAEILSVGGKEVEDGPVAFACEQVIITLRDAELAELRGLLADFEKAVVA